MARPTPRARRLPVLASAVDRLLSLNRDSLDYFEQVVTITGQDPALTVRVLQAANSSASSPVSRVDTVHAAVTRLGAISIRAMVGTIAANRLVTPDTDGERRLWIHAIEVAGASQMIAEAAGLGSARAHHLHLCGLLHDIGRFVMLDRDPAQLLAVDATGWDTPRGLVAAERAVAGLDHTDLGYEACLTWGMPLGVTAVVRDHHSAGASQRTGDAAEAANMGIVQFADLLSTLHHRGVGPALAGDTVELTGPVATIDTTEVPVRRDPPAVVAAAFDYADAHGLPRPRVSADALEHVVATMARTAARTSAQLGFATADGLVSGTPR